MIRRDRTRFWLALFGIVLVVVALYARTVWFGMIANYDDGSYILFRPEVRHWWTASWRQRLLTPKTGYPTPLPTFIYYHVRTWVGEGYLIVLHGLNIAVHVLNVVLGALLLRRWKSAGVALVVTLLWALHPINVEVVTWLTSLKTAIWGSCTLGILLLWSWRCDEGEGGLATRAAEVGISLLFVLGLASRPEIIMLPVVLAVVSFYRHGGWNVETSDLVVFGFMIALAAIYLPFALQGQTELVDNLGFGSYPIWGRFYRVMRALEMAVRHFLVPIDLHPEYYISYTGTWLRALPGFVLCLAFLAIGVGLAVRRESDLLFAFTMAALFYGPYAQLKPIPRVTADSYLYLPGLMTLFFGVSAIEQLMRAYSGERDAPINGVETSPSSEIRPSERTEFNDSESPSSGVALETSDEDATDSDASLALSGQIGLPRRLRRLGLAAVLVLSIAFAGLTHEQIDRWRNTLTLWGPIMEDSPRVWKPYFHVANGFRDIEKWEMAASVLEKGMPVFRAAKEYPAYIPLVYDQVGKKKKAITIAHEMVRRTKDPTLSHYVVYLRMLAKHDVPLRDDTEVREVTLRAIRLNMSRRYWTKEPQQTLNIADYAESHGLVAPIIEQLDREYERDQPHCLAWELVERLEPKTVADLDIPPRPHRCREDRTRP